MSAIRLSPSHPRVSRTYGSQSTVPSSSSCMSMVTKPVSRLSLRRHPLTSRAPPPPRCVSSSVSPFPAPTTPLKLLVKAEIPSKIPRMYLLKDLFQWSLMNLQEKGRERYGLPLTVRPYDDVDAEEDITKGFAVSFLKRDEEGGWASAVDMYVQFDDEIVMIHDDVRKNDAGMPELVYRNEKTQKGKYLEFKRREDNGIPKEMLEPLKGVLEELNGAVQTYYTFGSCFSHDST